MTEKNDIYHCDHLETEIRVKTTSDNRKQYRRQCLNCGCSVSDSMKQSVALAELGGVPANDFDESLKESWSQKRSEIARLERTENNQAWWENYKTYLNSEAWQIRRAKVLKRDCYLCQACLVRRATQVHHKTYEHVCAEPAFDLISICSECHEHLTKMDRDARNGVGAT